MYITWEEAKQKYPNKWVVLKDPVFGDEFYYKLIGGEFVGIADDQEEMLKLIPDIDDGHMYAPTHTREEGTCGVLKFGY